VRMKAVRLWKDEGWREISRRRPFRADLVEQAKEYREKMLEAAVELDDDVMAAWLDGKEPDEATISACCARR